MPDILTGYAALQPDKLAVVDDRPDGHVLTWTYAQLEAEANRLANALAGLGITAGDKVVWCGPNSPQVLAMMNAGRKLGAIAVALNYRLTSEEASYIVEHSDAAIAYVDAEYAQLVAPLLGNLDSLKHVIVFGGAAPEGTLGEDFVAAASADPLPDPPADADGGAGGAMTYTSGTTGKPKGAVRRRMDMTVALGLIGLIGCTADDIYLTTGPLYHSGPAFLQAVAIGLGQTTVLQRRFDAEDWLRLVDKYRVSTTFAAPAPIRMVCGLPAEVKARYDRSSMKRMIANAAPWSFALKQAYLADFPADSLWEVYGSTELGINCVLEPKDQLRKPGSCGKPAPGHEIVLFDDDGQPVTGTGPEHTGQLFARSGWTFDEYYKQPDSYVAGQHGDYHTVGDIAYRDDEGYYYICDRKGDMIISGGMNIYPAEIEAALEQHPDIFDVAVFGIPSENWGEAVHATVVLAPGATIAEADVTAFAREHLASYKVPRSVSFTDELPRTGSGKILKRQLRAPFWAGYSRQVG